MMMRRCERALGLGAGVVTIEAEISPPAISLVFLRGCVFRSWLPIIQKLAVTSLGRTGSGIVTATVGLAVESTHTSWLLVAVLAHVIVAPVVAAVVVIVVEGLTNFR